MYSSPLHRVTSLNPIFSDPEYFIRQFGLLAKSSSPLVRAIIAALKEAIAWHQQADKDRSVYRGMLGLRRSLKERDGASQNHRAITHELQDALERYRHRDRLEILNPFRALFDATCRDDGEFDTSKLQQSVFLLVTRYARRCIPPTDCDSLCSVAGFTGHISTFLT